MLQNLELWDLKSEMGYRFYESRKKCSPERTETIDDCQNRHFKRSRLQRVLVVFFYKSLCFRYMVWKTRWVRFDMLFDPGHFKKDSENRKEWTPIPDVVLLFSLSTKKIYNDHFPILSLTNIDIFSFIPNYWDKEKLVSGGIVELSLI